MKFREYSLPTDTNYVSLEEVPEDAKQILDIYDGIYGRTAVYHPERANELLDEFAGQQCFIAEEDDSDDIDLDILAVANYRQETKNGLAWLEGLAVHPEQRRRGVGRYVLENLVEITRESGLCEMRLKSVSVPETILFYQRNGFLVLDQDDDPLYTHMFREIK